MFYLGQSVTNQAFPNSPKEPAIISGFNQYDIPIITMVDKNGELIRHKQGFATDIKPIRTINKKSPTGYSIYHGKFYKKGIIGNIKLKLPSDEEVIKEFKNIQKLLDTV